MSLVDKIFVGGVWTDDSVRGVNVTGTPVTSAARAGTGEEISDTYTLTVSARTGGTGTVTVSAGANNPFNGRVVTGINFNGTSIYGNVVPGVNLVFASAGANGNTATIIVGAPFGSFDASGVGAGVPTTGVRHQVVNTATSDVTDAAVRLLTQAVMYRVTNKVFQYVLPFGGTTEKIAGGGSNRTMPYALTVAGVSGAGESTICNLSVDGVVLGAGTLNDLTAGTTVSGTGLKCKTTPYPYHINSGPLQGLEFALDNGVANGDKANILIFPSRYIQIAPDVSGVEGTYGIADVDLTESGQSTGTITASGVAYYWSRFLVPSGANNESNPYPCMKAIVGSSSTGAGWGA